MAMPCNLHPEENKEFLKDPQRRAALWDAAIDKYMKNGADVGETIKSLSAETGLYKQAIADALRPPDVPKRLTDALWAIQLFSGKK
jgi:hypothetical protein